MDPWRKKFDRRKYDWAVKRSKIQPTVEMRFVFYECWRCEEDENVYDGRFMVPYHSLPFYGTVYCPRCGKPDKVERMGMGMAEITWERNDRGHHRGDPSP